MNIDFRSTLIMFMLIVSVLEFSCKKEHVEQPIIEIAEMKNVVYIGSSNNNFYAISSVDGSEIWKYQGTKGFSYSDPLLHNGIVYTGSNDGNMYAFNSETGEVKWKYPTNFAIESSPAIAEGILYFGSNDTYFYALDAKDGRLLWKYKTGSNVSSSPLVNNGLVFFGGNDNYIYALNAKSGKLMWNYTTGGLTGHSSPVIKNNILFIGSRDGNLYALYAINGLLKWAYYTGRSLEGSRPVVSDGLVYVAGGAVLFNAESLMKGALYAIDEKTGKLIWDRPNDVGMYSDATVSNNKVFISSDDGNLNAFNAKDGTNIWAERIIPNGSRSTVADGLIFINGSGTLNFYALDENTGAVKWKSPILDGYSPKPCLVDSQGRIIQR